MSEVHCFTSATFAYLDRARVLAATLKTHNPDWMITLCLVDQEPTGWQFTASDEPFDNVVRISELFLPDYTRFLFEHTIVELCTAVKGAMLARLLADGHPKVVYLDPDIAVLAPLNELAGLLDTHDILLTPHQLVPDTDRKAIRDNEMGTLKYGMYNLGFIAVANRTQGRAFSDWWAARLNEHCFDDVADGIFTDQKWCDFVPAFFSGAHIIRDPGYNVASWNLSQRPITIDHEGTLRAANGVLKFFHFTKVDGPGLAAIEHYAGDNLAMFELLAWYVRVLAQNRASGLPDRYWAYGTYRNGAPIEAWHRRAYRFDMELRARYPDPFAAGPEIFAGARPSLA